MYGEAMTIANHSQDELSWKNLKALLKKQGIEAHADGIGNTRFSYKDGDENIFLGDKEAYLQTCYSCEVHYSISKKCWIGSACIHGNVLECIIGKSFSEVLEKILIANENYATSMSSLLSV